MSDSREVTNCDTCGGMTSAATIPCSACGVDVRVCDECAENRYVANDAEPTPYVCAFCTRVQKRSSEDSDIDDIRDVDEDGEPEPVFIDDDPGVDEEIVNADAGDGTEKETI